MTLVVRCRDVGFDCEGVVKAETEGELLQQVAQHAETLRDTLQLIVVEVQPGSGR